ncbi:MAG: tetratricopeptide repeat protein [Verrucomicrobia bacterium]|nr:tetratricopeptide repeat protein [Deltaproteobacteria bacterium]
MTHKQIISIVVLALLPLLSGCSLLGWKVSVVSVATEESLHPSIPVQERSFAGALELLRAGNEQAARDLLERVVDDPALDGVTDEALFRLSLLYLREEGSKGAVRALELLERLKIEFPTSLWTRQAAPLGVYLTGVKTLRYRQREVKTLKELNYSLSRDNREMRQSIERLKSLDLELEQKIKR